MTLPFASRPEPGVSPPHLAEVAPDLPLFQTFHYRIPERLRAEAAPGKRVLIPFGRRQITGYLLGFPDSTTLPAAKIKDILAVLDPVPLFDLRLLEFFRFAAEYYFAPLGEVLKSALPAGINLASRSTVRLSEPGRQALEGGEIQGAAGQAAAKIQAAGSLPAKSLSRSALAALRNRGFLEEDTAVGRARVGQKTEWVIEPAAFPNQEQRRKIQKRSPEQARLLELLQAGRTLGQSQIAGRFKDPLRLARSLARQGLVRIAARPVTRDPFYLDLEPEAAPERLMPEQARALSEIEAALESKAYATFLLRGVTGSGKTEVYLRAIRSCLDRGRSALCLVPEIALTPQLWGRFRRRFPEEIIALLHSGLSAGERFDQWRLIHSGQARIVLGARSAVFAPLSNLGLLVVDEEHETAYKQDDVFSYHARDLAVVRGQREPAVVVLGSATPSLESSFNTQAKDQAPAKYRSLVLSTRVDGRALPRVEIVDLRGGPEASEPDLPSGARVREADRRIGRRLFSPALAQALQETFAAHDQAIIFLNRRGFASFLLCSDCGERFPCPNCSVALTWHRKASLAHHDPFYGAETGASFLLCHYCGYHAPAPELCPKCFGLRVKPFGLGTERVEDEIAALMPEARLARMDSDTMAGKRSYFELLNRLRRRELDLVIGTQMVAKGHDFPHVTLVGVLLADLSLNFPDFRAGERTFQLLTQVAGRAGRGPKPGRVIIQTFNPEHYSIRLAVSQDYENFYREEMELRQALLWPPFARLANFRLSAPNPKAAAEAASELRRIARAKARRKDYREAIGLLGPARAPLYRIRGKSRWQMLVRSPSPALLGGFCREVFAEMRKRFASSKVVIALDRDPVNLL